MARTRQKRPQNIVLSPELTDSEMSEDNHTNDEKESDQHINQLQPNVTQNEGLNSVKIIESNNNDKNDSLREESNDLEISIYFIECESQELFMRNAFQSISDESNKLSKKWIDFNSLKEIESIANHLFVIKSFNGEVFDYLVEKKARIVGPLTVLFCYSSDCKNRFDLIPIKSYPILSQCMRKLIISVTNFDEMKRIELNHKIRRMCGTFSKDLTTSVTHLISDSVITTKYKVAKRCGITVITSEWVNACWRQYQYDLCHANHPNIINKYLTPIFKNLLICVSQIEFKARNGIKDIVEKNGGVYSGSLHSQSVECLNVILLLKEPKGEKFERASLKMIPCLDVEWLYDSVDEGYALPQDNYIITSNLDKCNTTLKFKPKNAINEKQNQPNKTQEIKIKALENRTKDSKINNSQTHKSLGDGINEKNPIEWNDRNIDGLPSQRPYVSDSQHITKVDDSKQTDEKEVEISKRQIIENEGISSLSLSSGEPMDISTPQISRGFMLSGFDEQTKSQLSKIITDFNGFVVVSNQILSSVTHLIIKTPNLTEKTLSSIASGVWILKDEYLIESQRKGAFVCEELYEWGLHFTENIDTERSSQTRSSLLKSSLNWRKFLNIENKNGIFQDCKVLILHKTRLNNSYARILSCGKADVVFFNEDIRIDDLSQFKFALIDLKELNSLPKSCVAIVEKLIIDNKLFTFQFIIDYLMCEPHSLDTHFGHQRSLIRDSPDLSNWLSAVHKSI